MRGGRVLMIAHHFPPAGGSGANRALAFARYLPDHGWTPTVLTPGVAWALHRDDRQLFELPPGLRLVRTRSWEPRPAVRTEASEHAAAPRPPFMTALRTHVGHLKRFPDAHIGWVPFALAAARGERFDLAYSSSGPYSSHLVGLMLKRLTGKPWVAELRDGWYRWNRAIFPDYPAWRDVLERRLEGAALRAADRVILVTDRMSSAFRCQFPDLRAEHFTVLPNGFDPAQFAPLTRASRPTWELLHAGSLYYGRSLAAFVAATNQLLVRDPGFARDFRLHLVGTLDASARAELAVSRLGADRLRLSGQLDHRATIEAMSSADALLLVANTTPGADATVPGKLFEYLAVGRPILAIAPRDSSTADLLRQTGGGWLAAADDPEQIACVLLRAYNTRDATAANPEQVARFDRRVLSGDLARVFDQVVADAARRA
jgi:glycosyltransferase involved in cell wall biosynthesis